MKHFVAAALFLVSVGAYAENVRPVSTPPARAAEPKSPETKIEVVGEEKNEKSEKSAAPKYAEVLKVDKRRDRLAISDDPKRQWARRDNICVFRVGRPIACGKVIAIGVRGAIAQLTPHTSPVKPGDEVRHYDPDRKLPEISDDQLSSEGMIDSKPYSYNISAGFNLSLDIKFPTLHFYWIVSPTIAVGLQGGYVKYTGSVVTSTLTGYGGVLTVDYFSQEFFRGFWGQFATGFYHLTAKQASVAADATGNMPWVSFIGGWREDWAHGLNVGAAIGARWLSPISDVYSDVKYNSIYPMALVEIGLSF